MRSQAAAASHLSRTIPEPHWIVRSWKRPTGTRHFFSTHLNNSVAVIESEIPVAGPRKRSVPAASG